MSVSRVTTFALAGCLISVLASSCSPGADVAADELRSVVERDGVVFDGSAIPDELLQRLAANRVVLMGETHHLREHWEFVAALVGDLYPEGFRQLLIEAPHMAAWLFDDYVQGGIVAPEWEPPAFWERRLAAIRSLNASLPPDDRIHVRPIDANEEWYGGAAGFEDLLGYLVDHLPERGPVDTFLGQGYATASAEEQTAALVGLSAAVAADRSELVAAWGEAQYQTVVELLEVELASVEIRAERLQDDNAGARLREQTIKQLVDRRIDECTCGTVINIGAHHAQKAHLMGTDQEWMGDYLAHTSAVVDGSIFVIAFGSARTELEPGAGGTPWDILAGASPENEVLRILAETWPGETVFLPLDDPLFAERTVAFNSEDKIYVTALQEQFDGLVQYGIAHRMPDN